jgi:hypothetical protein
VYGFVPLTLGTVLYLISPVLAAPVLARRAYGVIRAADPKRVLFAYISGVAAAFAFLHLTFQAVIDNGFYRIVDEAPKELAFVVIAFLLFLAWFGIRRSIEVAPGGPRDAKRGLSKSQLLWIVVFALIIYWLRALNNMVSYALVDYNNPVGILVYVVLPPLAYLLFGFLGDRGRERTGVTSGVILLLVAVQLTFLGSHLSMLAMPFEMVNVFTGTYLIYLMFTMPLNFFQYAKRPVFVASAGMGIYFLSRMFILVVENALPRSFMAVGAPLFVTTGISAIVFFALYYFILQRQRERTLAAALYSFVRSGQKGMDDAIPVINDTRPADVIHDEQEAAETQAMADAGFSPVEIEISMLLYDYNRCKSDSFMA